MTVTYKTITTSSSTKVIPITKTSKITYTTVKTVPVTIKTPTTVVVPPPPPKTITVSTVITTTTCPGMVYKP